MEMPSLFLWFDPYLIWLYRITGSAAVNFLLGTLALAVLSLAIGEITAFIAALLVRRPLEQVAGEAKRYQDLSMEALKAGDRPAYEAANRLANEAFGKSFFMQIALSATFFWPIFLALGWMQQRFLGVPFPLPLIGISLSYSGVFVILYIAAYCLFRPLKRRLPHVRRLKELRRASRQADGKLQGFGAGRAMLEVGIPSESGGGNGRTVA